jgi:hypothetical protein
MCCVGNVHKIIGIGIEIFPKRSTGILQKAVKFKAKKKYWLALQT